jgi:pimeloyl-ACP methyl ester carboxylesterase
MRKTYFTIFFLTFCSSLFIYSCKNESAARTGKKTLSTFISQDEMPDSISPAGIVELQIPSSGSIIYGFSYTANGNSLHPTVVLLHGMPGNERNLDLAQNLRRSGYNVVFFDYRGSWGSKGKYSFSNGIQDAGAVVNYITEPGNIQRLKIDARRIAFVGHSMGAGIALINGLENKQIKAVAGISVFNPYTILQGPKAPGNLLGLKEYISTLGMLNTDADTFLNDMVSHIKEYDIEQLIASTRKPVLVIDEHDNNNYLANYKKKKNLVYKIWETDHAFTNRRIALSTELKTWLDKNL